MTNYNIGYGFKFTDAALASDRRLASFDRAAVPNFMGVPLQWQKGDIVALQGVPFNRPLAVLARVWKMMADEAELTILLGLPEEPYAAALEEINRGNT